jgi:hypothetical protein
METKKLNYIIGGGVLLIAGAVFFWGNSSHSPERATVKYGEVDKVRKQEQTKSQLQREKVHIENYKQAPQINEGYQGAIDNHQEDGLRLEASVGSAAKDLAESDFKGMAVESLENKINQRLLNEQKTAQMNAFQKQQFANEYKKRALSMGYAVELNEQLEVIKVQKVEEPTVIKSNPVIDVDTMDSGEEY